MKKFALIPAIFIRCTAICFYCWLFFLYFHGSASIFWETRIKRFQSKFIGSCPMQLHCSTLLVTAQLNQKWSSVCTWPLQNWIRSARQPESTVLELHLTSFFILVLHTIYCHKYQKFWIFLDLTPGWSVSNIHSLT